MIGQGKWMTIENANPFIAAVAELESSVVSADNFGKIIIEIITGFFIIITSIILFLLSIP